MHEHQTRRGQRRDPRAGVGPDCDAEKVERGPAQEPPVEAWPHGGHLDFTADGSIKWRAHRRKRRWGGSCPDLA